LNLIGENLLNPRHPRLRAEAQGAKARSIMMKRF
jgi:hypothetical protein